MAQVSNAVSVGIVTGPAAGTYSEFTTNTPADANANFDSTMLTNWCGTTLVNDFGTDGGEVTRGGGHVGFQNEYGGVLVLDRGTKTYVARCIPALAPQHRQNDAYNSYGAFTANGAPKREHTYNCLSQMPTSWGGGTEGSLVQVGLSGGIWAYNGPTYRGKGCTYRFDLSQTTDGHHNMTNDYSAGSFPYDWGDANTDGVTDNLCTAIDYGRQGWWTKAALYTRTGGKLIFTSKTGQVTIQTTPITNRERGSLHYFADDDILVYLTSFGVDNPLIMLCNPGAASWSNAAAVTGTPPPPYPSVEATIGYMGMQWSTLLNCFVGLCQLDAVVDSTHLKVYKLTPPTTGNRFTGTWAWSTETVASADASTVATADGGLFNGALGRLIEWPAMRCLTFTRDWNKKAIWMRLTGM